MNRLRFCLTTTLLLACVWGILLFVPAPAAITFPVIVKYDDLVVVRAEANGFVDRIFVGTGQQVGQHQPLAVLRNTELVQEHVATKLQLESEQLKARSLEANGEIAELQKQLDRIDVIADRVKELGDLIDRLVIRAPIAGTVSTLELDSKLGMFAQPGMEIMEVGSSERPKLIGLVDQDEAKWLRSAKQPKVTARIWGQVGKLLECSVSQIPPRASQIIQIPAFAASNSGPLPVMDSAQGEKRFASDDLSRTQESIEGLKFLRPHVEVALAPRAKAEFDLLPGEMGVAKIRSRDESMGEYLAAEITRVVSRNLQPDSGI